MFNAITDFFNNEIGGGDAAATGSEQGIRTATCALLLELAWADGSFDASEREAITALLRSHFGMTADKVAELLAGAEAARNESTDVYAFTKLIRDRFEPRDVLGIVESLWRVVYSDGLLEAHEDAMMHKLSRLLGIGHREMIAMKLRAKSGA